MSLVSLSPWISDKMGGEEAKMGILCAVETLNSRSVPESGQILDISMCSGASSARTCCCSRYNHQHTHIPDRIPLFLSPAWSTRPTENQHKDPRYNTTALTGYCTKQCAIIYQAVKSLRLRRADHSLLCQGRGHSRWVSISPHNGMAGPESGL